METVSLEIVVTRPSGRVPVYASPLASGADLFAANDDTIVLAPGDRILVPTGIKLAIPDGYEVQIRPRSGLALRHGITMVNSPGTIDADYRGEIQLILLNTGNESFIINPGDRIGQMVLCPVFHARFETVSDLTSTDRGTGGFGSTGT